MLCFLLNYTEENEVFLPGIVPGYSRSDIKLLPSSVSKCRLWKVYNPAAECNANAHVVMFSAHLHPFSLHSSYVLRSFCVCFVFVHCAFCMCVMFVFTFTKNGTGTFEKLPLGSLQSHEGRNLSQRMYPLYARGCWQPEIWCTFIQALSHMYMNLQSSMFHTHELASYY